MKGTRIGVTAGRKGSELTDALTRRGARVVYGPTVVSVPPAADNALLDETEAVLAGAPSWLVASTGVGMTAWAEAAERAGRGAALRALVATTPAAARGPKALGGLRRLGGDVRFISPQETDADVARWLAGRIEHGQALAVQVHGADTGAAYARLAAGGVTLLRVAPYRCVQPEDLAPARRLVRRAVEGALDVVVATSPSAASNLFEIAASDGLRDALAEALRTRVAAAAVGPVTARAFEAAGAPVSVMPTRYRTADLIRAIEGFMQRSDVDGRRHPDGIQLCPETSIARCGPRAVSLGPLEFGVLAALVRRPHIVCTPRQIAREAWGHQLPGDPSQVKHQISRLRRKLGPAGAALQTVRGVGYRYWPAETDRSTP